MRRKTIEVHDRVNGPDYHPPQTIRWHARQQGDLLEVKRVTNYSHIPVEAKRGNIMGFTASARNRMIRTVARIAWDKVSEPNFVTLTYPDAIVNRTYGDRTQDRSLFIRYMEEDMGVKVPCLWRVEWIDRKSGRYKGEVKPHLHMVTLAGRHMDKAEATAIWRRVTQIKGPLQADAKPANDSHHAAMYAAKYAAKQKDLGHLDNNAYLETHGRAWGITRKSKVPWSPVRRINDMSEDARRAAMGIAARLLGRDYEGSFFVLGNKTPELLYEIAEKGSCTIDTLAE